jgi:hypothetical protein
MRYTCKHCGEVYPYEPVFCNDCGTRFSSETFTIQTTERTKALEWWTKKSLEDQIYVAIEFNEFITGDKTRHPHTLTGREIEILWDQSKKE